LESTITPPPAPPRGRSASAEVQAFVGVPAKASDGRSASVVVLNPVAVKSFCAAVIHLDRNRETELAHRPTKEFRKGGLEAEELRGFVKLGLGDFQRIRVVGHAESPSFSVAVLQR
jgi:hypothetical protein